MHLRVKCRSCYPRKVLNCGNCNCICLFFKTVKYIFFPLITKKKKKICYLLCPTVTCHFHQKWADHVTCRVTWSATHKCGRSVSVTLLQFTSLFGCIWKTSSWERQNLLAIFEFFFLFSKCRCFHYHFVLSHYSVFHNSIENTANVPSHAVYTACVFSIHA